MPFAATFFHSFAKEVVSAATPHSFSKSSGGEIMSRFRKNRWKLQSFCFSLIVFLSLPSVGSPADAPAPGVQGAAPGSPEAQAAKGLALDEVVRIALDNHSSVKNAQFQ